MSRTDLRAAGVSLSPVVVGAVAGLVAGVPMGVALQFGTDVLPILGAVVGNESLVAGWVVHLFASAFMGALFGWLVTWPVFRTLTGSVGECVLLGLVHSMLLALLMIGFVLPGMVELLELSGEGIPAFRVPGPSRRSLLSAGVFGGAHVVWGIVLGLTYAVLGDVESEPEPRGPDGSRGRSESE